VIQPITLRAQIVAVVGCALVFLFVLEMVRRRRLKEEYSILWMAVTLGAAVLALWDDLLLAVTRAIGAYDANSIIFFFGLLFLSTLLFHLSVRVSELADRNKDLVQELALLAHRLEAAERGRREP